MIYASGNASEKLESDCFITYEPTSSGGINLNVKSKVEVLYGSAIKRLCNDCLSEFGIHNCNLTIEDGGALPFVMAARLEACIKDAHSESHGLFFPVNKSSYNAQPIADRFRRTRLYLPGNQPKYMLNAGIHQPDAIILDLEDSVSLSEKDSARLIVRNALHSLDFFNCEKMVRINQGERGVIDLQAIISENVHVILIPKVENADELREIDEKVNDLIIQSKRTEDLFFLPIIESAKGVLNAYEIAGVSKRNVGLAIGLEDYTADIGTQRTTEGTESIWARSMIVNAAKACRIQALDTVFSDVTDMDGLYESTLESKQLGFEGRGCIHPRQIQVIHEAFYPSEKELEYAKRVILAFDKAQKDGLGVISLGSKMIDPPVVKRADSTIKLALHNGILPTDWKEQAGAIL
jgi:citrate lyase subunit beta / citryl-CoA lyase